MAKQNAPQATDDRTTEAVIRQIDEQIERLDGRNFARKVVPVLRAARAVIDAGHYDANVEWATLFQLEADGQPPPIEQAMAFLRLWANSYLLKGSYWDVPQTMGAALNQAIRILEPEIAHLRVQGALQTEVERLRNRASCLEDAAFHFQTCRTCKDAGEDSCPDGRQFAAFLRGEDDGD